MTALRRTPTPVSAAAATATGSVSATTVAQGGVIGVGVVTRGMHSPVLKTAYNTLWKVSSYGGFISLGNVGVKCFICVIFCFFGFWGGFWLFFFVFGFFSHLLFLPVAVRLDCGVNSLYPSTL